MLNRIAAAALFAFQVFALHAQKSVVSKTEEISELSTVLKSFCSQAPAYSGEYSATIAPKVSLPGISPSAQYPAQLSFKCPTSFRIDLTLPTLHWSLLTNGIEAWIVRRNPTKTFAEVEEYNSLAKRKLGVLLNSLEALLNKKTTPAQLAALAEELNWKRLKEKAGKAYSLELVASAKGLPRFGLSIETLHEPRISALTWEDAAMAMTLEFNKTLNLPAAREQTHYRYFPSADDEVQTFTE